jgi:hypothetical protein
VVADVAKLAVGRGASGQGEVVQRGQDHPGMPLARRRRLDGTSASPDALRAAATRCYSGAAPAASTSPKCRYTCASVRALPPTDTASAAVDPGVPTILARGHSSASSPAGR